MKRLAIIVPCYNEQEVLVNTTGQLIAALERLRNEKMIEEGRIVYVDDGSRDRTWELIEEQAIASPWSWVSSWLITQATNMPFGQAWSVLWLGQTP